MKQTFIWLILPLLLCAAYVFGFQYPAAMDIPNHLARAHILNTCIGGSSEEICKYFRAEFQPISYFFADYTIMVLLRVFSDPFTAGRTALFVMLAINILGWHYVFLRVRGGLNAAYVVGLLLIFSNFYYKGFYAYVVGNGAFLFWLAFWWPRRDLHSFKHSVALSVTLAMLFLCHLAAFFSALICYCAYALWSVLSAAGPERVTTVKSYFRDWFFFVAFVSMYGFQQFATSGALMGHLGMQGLQAGSSTVDWWVQKLMRFSYVTFNHSKIFDSIVFALACLFLVSLVNPRSLRRDSRHFWLFCGLFFVAAYLVTPDISHGGSDVDLRFLLPGYFILILGLGVLIEDSRSSRMIAAVLALVQFSFNLSYQFPMQQQLDTMSKALGTIPPGQRLVEVNSRYNFPTGKHSRVNPLSHFSAYYLLRGGVLVDGLINCYMNPNLPYFCYRDQNDATMTFKYGFQGLPFLNADDLAQLSERFNYVLLIEPAAELVEEKLPRHQFERIFHEGDVYVLKTGRRAPSSEESI